VAKKKIKKGPQFIQWFNPVLRALKELGGSGTVSEVVELVAKFEAVPEDVQKEKLNSGGLRFNNQVQFARQYLVWEGLLESSSRGVWSLTERGAKTDLTRPQALKIFEKQHALHQGTRKKASLPSEGKEDGDNDIDSDAGTYKVEVLELLKKLSPTAFEHFSKRLLREYGFEKVEVTGGPKDKGIDGTGILKVNPFVSFRVAFQCKRYDQAVVSSAISTFRGSIPSSVDKGILITTGYFTADAKTLAQDPGLKPIELIDGDQLVVLMEEMELGLNPTFKVDTAFFDEFP
jgi:restriction system protein